MLFELQVSSYKLQRVESIKQKIIILQLDILCCFLRRFVDENNKQKL